MELDKERNEEQHNRSKIKERKKKQRTAFIVACTVCGLFVGAEIVKAVFLGAKTTVTLFGKELIQGVKPDNSEIEEVVKMGENIANQLPDFETELSNITTSNGLPDSTASSEAEFKEKETDEFAPAEITVQKEIPSENNGTIIEIIDSESYIVSIGGEEYRVRLKGVDVDENAVFDGRKASEIITEKLHVGDAVTLKYEEPYYDRYSRLLAYVYFSDGEMIQKWLIQNQYASVLEGYEDKFVID